MQPDRWARIQDLYLEVSARPRDEQASYLAEACAGDPDLFRAVKRLLTADTHPDPLFSASVDELVALTAEEDEEDAPDPKG